MLLPPQASAQTAAYTAPTGIISISAAAGTGATPTISVLSFPLYSDASVTGQTSGVITGVTANSISNSSAGWSACALSVPASPYLIQITSGSAVGRTFLISTTATNTSTTVTIDAEESAKVNLTSLGIATGSDTYTLFPCDTLLGIFGPGSTTVTGTTVLGGASPTGVDIVQLFVLGAWRQYYYNTTTKNWKRAGFETISDNVPIRSDAGVLYSRLANTPLSMTLTGKAPIINRQAIIANSGVTFVSSSWPVDLTLATSNIAAIPGWVANSSATVADIVQIQVQGAWRQYYYDGTHWYRAGFGTLSDAVAIPMGSAVMLQKKGSTTGATSLLQTIPYSL